MAQDGDDGGDVPRTDPSLRTIRSSMGACNRTMDRTSLHTIRRIRNTKGHTILLSRTGRTIRDISTECMTMCSSTKDQNAGKEANKRREIKKLLIAAELDSLLNKKDGVGSFVIASD